MKRLGYLVAVVALAAFWLTTTAFTSVPPGIQWKLDGWGDLQGTRFGVRGVETDAERASFSLRLYQNGQEIAHSIPQASADFSNAIIAADGSVMGEVRFETQVFMAHKRAYAMITYQHEDGEAPTLQIEATGLHINITGQPSMLHLTAWQPAP